MISRFPHELIEEDINCGAVPPYVALIFNTELFHLFIIQFVKAPSRYRLRSAAE